MSIDLVRWVLLVVVVVCPLARAADDALAPPVKLSAEQDHQRLMKLLGIASIPPGASGQHPNYDESKANPFPNLPDPLMMNDGTKVTTADMWWKQRRPEIVEHFDREIYGRVPGNTPKVTWEVTNTTKTDIDDYQATCWACGQFELSADQCEYRS